MRHNPELLAVVAFGAALALGLAGAPMWMAVATGAVYGFDTFLSLSNSTTGTPREESDAVQQQAGVFTTRVGAILLAYGCALGLRIVGNA